VRTNAVKILKQTCRFQPLQGHERQTTSCSSSSFKLSLGGIATSWSRVQSAPPSS
jgi:hypothetical protein